TLGVEPLPVPPLPVPVPPLPVPVPPLPVPVPPLPVPVPPLPVPVPPLPVPVPPLAVAGPALPVAVPPLSFPLLLTVGTVSVRCTGNTSCGKGGPGGSMIGSGAERENGEINPLGVLAMPTPEPPLEPPASGSMSLGGSLARMATVIV